MPASGHFEDYFIGLDTEAAPDPAADYLMIHDDSAGAVKKTLIEDITTAAGGIPASGWVPAGETWVYVSADDPTYVFKIAGVDLTGKYQAGQRIKLAQSTGGTKYGIVTKVEFSTDTSVTVYMGTDYDLANEAISDPYYSPVKAPFGFPLDPAKWTVTVTDTSLQQQATPTQDTWYNLGGITISIPIGVWRVNYKVTAGADKNTVTVVTVKTTLSTANNTESDADFTTFGYAIGASGNLRALLPAFVEKTIAVASKTSYYLNTLTTTAATVNTLYNHNSDGKLVIRATCAYL